MTTPIDELRSVNIGDFSTHEEDMCLLKNAILYLAEEVERLKENSEELCEVIIQRTVAGEIKCANEKPCSIHDVPFDPDNNCAKTAILDMEKSIHKYCWS